ncbi:low-temperature-induced 65 kDa protein-like, partial [Trifolium medium]|nr:low-temperature-induced 65 kDa protein-like [Trifolium medium]
EEDKALSEVISEALHKGKEEPLKKEDGKVDSEVEKSENVFEESNVNSSGKGVVGKVKDVVGSWFVKSPQ